MSTEPHSAFERVLAAASTDPAVVAAFLTGSRGKHFHHPASDYDLYLVLRDPATSATYRSEPGLDLTAVSWSALEHHAAWGSAEAWDRYDFLHVAILFDHSGELARMLHEKSAIPEGERTRFTAAALDAYINGLYRSLKCHRRQERLGQKLEAANSLPPLLQAIFALRGRPCPFPGYLRQELEAYPLDIPSVDTPSFPAVLEDILSTATPASQQALLAIAEPLFRDHGYAPVFDAWKELDWIRTYEELIQS